MTGALADPTLDRSKSYKAEPQELGELFPRDWRAKQVKMPRALPRSSSARLTSFSATSGAESWRRSRKGRFRARRSGGRGRGGESALLGAVPRAGSGGRWGWVWRSVVGGPGPRRVSAVFCGCLCRCLAMGEAVPGAGAVRSPAPPALPRPAAASPRWAPPSSEKRRR